VIAEVPPNHSPDSAASSGRLRFATAPELHGFMLSSRRGQLPRGLVRDLLGITRALYRAELAAGGDPVRLQQLADVGGMLREALELSRGEPDTLGHRAAWSWAEKATRALGEFVGETMPIAPAIRAAVAKLK